MSNTTLEFAQEALSPHAIHYTLLLTIAAFWAFLAYRGLRPKPLKMFEFQTSDPNLALFVIAPTQQKALKIAQEKEKDPIYTKVWPIEDGQELWGLPSIPTRSKHIISLH